MTDRECRIRARADTLHAGDGSLVPPRTPRTALDVRPQLDRMLSAHIVEAGQPLATLAD